MNDRKLVLLAAAERIRPEVDRGSDDGAGQGGGRDDVRMTVEQHGWVNPSGPVFGLVCASVVESPGSRNSQGISGVCGLRSTKWRLNS